jgi:hypothetical protein
MLCSPGWDETITPQASEEEDKKVTIVRAEREKPPTGISYRISGRAIGQFGPRLDRVEREINSPGQITLLMPICFDIGALANVVYQGQ